MAAIHHNEAIPDIIRAGEASLPAGEQVFHQHAGEGKEG